MPLATKVDFSVAMNCSILCQVLTAQDLKTNSLSAQLVLIPAAQHKSRLWHFVKVRTYVLAISCNSDSST